MCPAATAALCLSGECSFVSLLIRSGNWYGEVESWRPDDVVDLRHRSMIIGMDFERARENSPFRTAKRCIVLLSNVIRSIPVHEAMSHPHSRAEHGR